MANQYCEFIKNDGTRCKNFAQSGHAYCKLHLTITETQETIDSKGEVNTSRGFNLIIAIFSIGFWVGLLYFSVSNLLTQLSYINSYYSLGQNSIAKWAYRVFSTLRYLDGAVLYTAILGEIFVEKISHQKWRRIILISMLALPLAIGIENLIYYQIVGWDYLNRGQILEGFWVLFAFLNVIVIFLASKYRTQTATKFLGLVYDTLWTISPIILVFALSSGDSSYFVEKKFLWLDSALVVFNLYLFSVGIDDLKGTPSLLSRTVIFYFGASTGELSLQAIQSKKAEALQIALQKFQRLSPLQQEQLSEWIVLNFKPNTIQRIWGIIKLVVATFLLTIIAQEPAVAFLKWLLKYFFDISY